MPSSLKPIKARPVKLRPDLTLEQGFAQIARSCLRQIRANEGGLLTSSDPEFVHQMRVGLRRLRSALSLFKPWIVPPPALADEIAWLGQALGAARDAEVLAGTTLPALLQACADLEDLVGLQKAATSLAQGRRRKAVLALKSERYLGLMDELQGWLKQGGWRTSSPRPDELGLALDAQAKQMLKRRKKKLRLGALFAQEQPSAEARHRLRIAVKKLRYATEFFRSMASSEKLKQLSAAQDLLGQLNDAEIARGLLLELAAKRPALLAPAAFARGVMAAQSARHVAALEPLLQKLFGPKTDPEA